jgi:hypothetical protein
MPPEKSSTVPGSYTLVAESGNTRINVTEYVENSTVAVDLAADSSGDCGDPATSSGQPACAVSTTGQMLVYLLAKTNCVITPGSESEIYKLTIQPDIIGNYKVRHGNSGYSWNSPTSGIEYCVTGDTNVTFREYRFDAAVRVDTELMPSDGCTTFIPENSSALSHRMVANMLQLTMLLVVAMFA